MLFRASVSTLINDDFRFENLVGVHKQLDGVAENIYDHEHGEVPACAVGIIREQFHNECTGAPTYCIHANFNISARFGTYSTV